MTSTPNNYLQQLTDAKRTTIDQKIKILQIQNDQQRLEVELLRLRNEQKFWTKNLVALIALIISAATLFVTYYLNRTTQSQRDKEIEFMQASRAEDSAINDARWKSQRKSDAFRFIVDKIDIFAGKDERQRELAKVTLNEMLPQDELINILAALESFAGDSKVREKIRLVRDYVFRQDKNVGHSNETRPILIASTPTDKKRFDSAVLTANAALNTDDCANYVKALLRDASNLKDRKNSAAIIGHELYHSIEYPCR